MSNSCSHIFIKWYGNKLNEYKKFKDYINFDNKINIIEPFCGSAAISFKIWLEYGDKFNYYINDKDELIYNYLNYNKNVNLSDLIDRINIEKRQYDNDEKFQELYEKSLVNQEDFIYKILISKLSFYSTKMRSKYTIRTQPWLTISKLNKNQIKFKEFLNSPNVFITNDDWSIIFEKFKDDKQALIILDPPYIKSYNSFYNKECQYLDVYNKLDDIRNNNATSYFIIEKIKETDDLFKDWNNIIIYNKEYKLKMKKTFHTVYSN